ncbi:MAG: HAD-IA family hydrolase [Eubacteriales bacterium]|nr:HAD-IA family hydrolase [Eubacteriales bacterium]
MRKNLVWDFDGTLYDTYPQMAVALVKALEDFHCKADEAEAYALMKKTLFYAVTVYAERFGLKTEVLLAAFRERHAEQRAFVPMAGLVDCLEATASLGCRHYLFTHRDHRAVDQLATDGLLRLFTDCVTREDGFADKPSPEALLYLMNLHRFPAAEAYMIGDRDIDIDAGNAAGIAGVLLDPGRYYPQVAARYRIVTLNELPALLSK